MSHAEYVDWADLAEYLDTGNTIVANKKLTDQNIVNADFGSIYFNSTEFKNCCFVNCAFVGTVFTICSFNNCKFTDCVFVDCRFRECWLKKVRIYSSTIISCCIRKVKAALLEMETNKIKDSNFIDCQLIGSTWTYSTLSRVVFKSDLDKSYFSFCALADVDFGFCNLSDADFSNCELKDLILNYSTLTGTDLPYPFCHMQLRWYPVCVYENFTVIGCEKHSNDFWLNQTEDSVAINAMAPDAAVWWKRYSSIVKEAISNVQQQAEDIRKGTYEL